jgi:hypothetical protein
MKPQWLAWARDLESVAQNGRHYAKDHYGIQRYETVRRIAAEILATKFDGPGDVTHRQGVRDEAVEPAVHVRLGQNGSAQSFGGSGGRSRDLRLRFLSFIISSWR